LYPGKTTEWLSTPRISLAGFCIAPTSVTPVRGRGKSPDKDFGFGTSVKSKSFPESKGLRQAMKPVRVSRGNPSHRENHVKLFIICQPFLLRKGKNSIGASMLLNSRSLRSMKYSLPLNRTVGSRRTISFTSPHNSSGRMPHTSHRNSSTWFYAPVVWLLLTEGDISIQDTCRICLCLWVYLLAFISRSVFVLRARSARGSFLPLIQTCNHPFQKRHCSHKTRGLDMGTALATLNLVRQGYRYPCSGEDQFNFLILISRKLPLSNPKRSFTSFGIQTR